MHNQRFKTEAEKEKFKQILEAISKLQYWGASCILDGSGADLLPGLKDGAFKRKM